MCALNSLVFALLCGSCLSAPSSGAEGQGQKLAKIVKSVAEQQNDGSYFFAYESEDGSYREETGILRKLAEKQEKTDDENVIAAVELIISGTYSYIDSSGQLVEVSYVADKNGFVPQGTNIPKEITEAALNAAERVREKEHIGSINRVERKIGI